LGTTGVDIDADLFKTGFGGYYVPDSYFKLKYSDVPGVQEYTLSPPLHDPFDTTVSHGLWDVTIPRPQSPYTGYYVFFYGVGVSSYRNPSGSPPPDPDRFFLFYLDPDYVYRNHSLWMDKATYAADGMPLTGFTEVEAGAEGALRVLPLGLHTVAGRYSFMKSRGVGNEPLFYFPY
jgi:hypothetical protein